MRLINCDCLEKFPSSKEMLQFTTSLFSLLAPIILEYILYYNNLIGAKNWNYEKYRELKDNLIVPWRSNTTKMQGIN